MVEILAIRVGEDNSIQGIGPLKVLDGQPEDGRIVVHRPESVVKDGLVYRVSRFEVKGDILYLNKGFCKEKSGILYVTPGGIEIEADTDIELLELIPGVYWQPTTAT